MNRKNQKIGFLSFISIALCVVVLFSVFGCATVGSKLAMSHAVADIFETNKIISKYDYYYSGPEDGPRAIVAIDRDITFEQGLWQHVDLTPDRLSTWNLNINNRSRIIPYYYGAYIIDPTGKQVGMWYSYETMPTIVWAEDGKKVTIFTPDIDSSPWEFYRHEKLIRVLRRNLGSN